MVIKKQSKLYPDNAHQRLYLQSKIAFTENFDFLLVAIFRGLIVEINDESMEIGIKGTFCILISK